DSRAESERARCLGEKHREISARAPASIKRLKRRLRASTVPLRIADLRGDSGADIVEQRERIGRMTGNERLCPRLQSARRVPVLRHCERAEIGPFVIVLGEWIEKGR